MHHSSLSSVDELVACHLHFLFSIVTWDLMLAFCYLVQVYYSEDIMTVPVTMIEGKCEVRMKDDLPNSNLPVVVEHVFYCEHLFDPVTGALKQVRHSEFHLSFLSCLDCFS